MAVNSVQPTCSLRCPMPSTDLFSSLPHARYAHVLFATPCPPRTFLFPASSPLRTYSLLCSMSTTHPFKSLPHAHHPPVLFSAPCPPRTCSLLCHLEGKCLELRHWTPPLCVGREGVHREGKAGLHPRQTEHRHWRGDVAVQDARLGLEHLVTMRKISFTFNKVSNNYISDSIHPVVFLFTNPLLNASWLLLDALRLKSMLKHNL